MTFLCMPVTLLVMCMVCCSAVVPDRDDCCRVLSNDEILDDEMCRRIFCGVVLDEYICGYVYDENVCVYSEILVDGGLQTKTSFARTVEDEMGEIGVKITLVVVYASKKNKMDMLRCSRKDDIADVLKRSANLQLSTKCAEIADRLVYMVQSNAEKNILGFLAIIDANRDSGILQDD